MPAFSPLASPDARRRVGRVADQLRLVGQRAQPAHPHDGTLLRLSRSRDLTRGIDPATVPPEPEQTAMRDQAAIEQRKNDHIRINLEERVQATSVGPGLDRYRFVHTALPELDLAEIDLRTTFLGRRLGAPLLISSMTGGVERGWEINRRL